MNLTQLPTQARLERYERQAEDLVEGDKSSLADAQLAVARCNYFDSWLDLAGYVDAVMQEASPICCFESAVDAIVDGNLTELERLLRENPELIRARSTRRHRATLLHYIGANGTEKQMTSKNAVAIAKVLLDAGAEVNAVGEMYGGTTTLGLVATSVHPVRAGLQEPLMEILLECGAGIEGAVAQNYTRGSVVNACLANGRPNAAEFLAKRGARLDLDGAAGVGRLDVVKAFFHEDGSLQSHATTEQLHTGFIWACGCGRVAVVEFLLAMGVGANVMPCGETGLHSAAHGGHLDIVKLLLERKSDPNSKDKTYDATPLGWALCGWGHPPEKGDGRYCEIVELLVSAGAAVEPEFLANEHVRSDPRMLAALRGE